MLKSKLYRRLLVIGITGTLLISSGVIAFAATTNSDTAPKSKVENRGFMQKGELRQGNAFQAVLKKEVTAGVITQAEADKITAFLKTKEAEEKVKRDAEKAKLDAMTDAERKAYMKANKPARTDVLAELVTAGLLTQAQSDTIKATMPQGPMGRNAGKPMQQGNPLAAVLKTQVTAGVITQEVSDKVTAFVKTKEDAEKAKRDAEKAKFDAMTDAEKKADKEAKKAAKDAQKAKLDAMTDAERKAYMEANKPVKENILKELVTAGILTQDQADKIQAAMPKRIEMSKQNGKQARGAFKKNVNSAGKTNTITE
jgi:hypothetical protein